jgi:hypothetical protein
VAEGGPGLYLLAGDGAVKMSDTVRAVREE